MGQIFCRERLSPTVQQLLKNDPQQVEIRIYLEAEPSQRKVAEALRRNQYISRLSLYFSQFDITADTPKIFKVIAEHPTLKNLAISTVYGRPSPPLVGIFLKYLQRNSNIQEVHFTNLDLPIADTHEVCSVSSYLDSATSLKSLSFDSCSTASRNSQEVRTTIGAALQRNTNITFIELLRCNRKYFSLPVVHSLEKNTSVKTLKICADGADHQFVDPCTLQKLLERSHSLEALQFQFQFPDWVYSDTIFTEALSQSLINSASVTNLSFQGTATYPHHGAQGYSWVQQICNIFQNKTNLCSLHCDMNIIATGNLVQVLAAVLRRPCSSIRNLTLGNIFIWTPRPRGSRRTNLETLLYDIALSQRLEKLRLWTIHSRENLEPVLQMLRVTQHLKELELRISDEARDAKYELLDAT